MRRLLRQLRPGLGFEDIVALIALYRPGPMEEIPSTSRASATARSSTCTR